MTRVLGLLPGLRRWRVVLHPCDLEVPSSMVYFDAAVEKLRNGGVSFVRQRDLWTPSGTPAKVASTAD